MKKYFILLFVSAAILGGCKKNSTDPGTTSTGDYFMKFNLGGTSYNVTDTVSSAYVYNDRSEGEIGYTLNGVALFPPDSIGRFDDESQLMSLLNLKLPINAIGSSFTGAQAQVFVWENFVLYHTPLATTAENDYPAHYLKITKITYLYTETGAYTLKFYKVEGEFNCVAGRTSPSQTKTLTGTFRLQIGIDVS